MAKDYYATLGVSKTATEKEIKQAFRKLAKKYHPDANPDDPTAEQRFKEINEAYETLSDTEKRARYDQFGSGYAQAGGFGGNTQYTNVDMGDMGDILEQIFGSRGRGGASSGTSRNSGRGGFGFGGFSGFGQQEATRGRDIEQPVSITLQEAYSGTTRLITKGERTIRVNIPAGATNGTKVRLAGEGEPGVGGAEAGDLYLITQVEPDNQFERQGDDLTTEVKVDMFTAMLGGEVEVPTLGRPIRLKIPAGTQSGRKFRLGGKGMPRLREKDQFGDLYARILITVPEKLTAQQRDKIEELRHALES
jgi:curved DNA-binding protein